MHGCDVHQVIQKCFEVHSLMIWDSGPRVSQYGHIIDMYQILGNLLLYSHVHCIIKKIRFITHGQDLRIFICLIWRG